MAAERQWWQSAWLMLGVLSVAVGILAGAIVAVYANTRPSVYESKATLLIDQQPAIFETGDEGLLAKLARLRFKYVGLVGTLSFAEPVAEGLDVPVAEVHQGLSADADVDTLLLVITADMSTADDARRVATAAADELVRYVHDEQLDADIAVQDQVMFTVVSPATGAVQTEPSTKKVILEGVVAFLIVSVVGGLAADLLRRRTV